LFFVRRFYPNKSGPKGEFHRADDLNGRC